MAKEKVKKSIFKKWWFWVVVVIIIGAIATNGGEDSTEKSSSEPKSEVKKVKETSSKSADTEKKTETPKKEEKPAAKKGVLTKEKFEQIKDGMTYEEVVAIVGSEGTVLSESGEKGTDLHTVMYEFEADGGFGANANMMFQGNKLINKAQFGLGGGDSGVEITKEEFDKIQNGMTYEEVQKIIGGEGEVISESGEKGSDIHTIMIQYNGKGGLGANANFMFQGNKLQNKAQYGL
ncbi:DUF3862 domain-containing protein [Neobacillus drentensis]|uniref:DUF3862 domain-containing protein n=1 Tax=Neobacillus drentensis TaxID=220684 RepID=UPI002FFEDD55